MEMWTCSKWSLAKTRKRAVLLRVRWTRVVCRASFFIDSLSVIKLL